MATALLFLAAVLVADAVELLRFALVSSARLIELWTLDQLVRLLLWLWLWLGLGLGVNLLVNAPRTASVAAADLGRRRAIVVGKTLSITRLAAVVGEHACRA